LILKRATLTQADFSSCPIWTTILVQIARAIRCVVLCTEVRENPASSNEHCCPQQDRSGLDPKAKLFLHNGGAGADIAQSLAKSGTAGYQPADQVKAQPVDKPEKISNRRSSECVSPVRASDSDLDHRFTQRGTKARFEQPNVGMWSRYNAPKTPVRACKSLRIRVAANTMAVKEGSTSFQPRVLSPQSGFTQI